MDNKYREYFDIDENYFPQVNDSTIAAAGPDFWKQTYPHQTFIEMLIKMERVLSRLENRSLWIEGAYGTGKSQCAYALKKILDVPEEKLSEYWNLYDPLKKKPDLLKKILGHKEKGIVTVYRYASGEIGSPRDLFFAVQESVKAVLKEKNLYTGENTLKEGVIEWLSEPEKKQFFDALLQKPEWAATFSQSKSEEIINTLEKCGEVRSLMENIFRLADKEGITALNIDTDILLEWLTDIIDRNDIKLVFIWDEFSDYFKNNKESLTEFQKLVELVNAKPFYFIVVTHETGQLFSIANDTWTKIRDRFIPVQIALPDNIAFNLIGHAFKIKPAALDNWNIIADDLNSRLNSSREAVMREVKITEPEIVKNIMPIHPMAALLLKNIAAAFKSNQRSMFDFIKSSDTEGLKAFQWFVENIGPIDDHPLLTVDMLWDFFYEKGKENLTSDIRLILDTFPQQQNLNEKEKSVLKAILIMQAMDQRTRGTIGLFKATDQNLCYVFEGIQSGLDIGCKNIAKGLVAKGILVSNPINGGKYAYGAAVLAGDQTKIENYKKDIKKNGTTSKLVTEGDLGTVLSLTPALRLRFESEPGTGKITPVNIIDFTRTINRLRDETPGWDFQAVIAFALDDIEAYNFREKIKSAVANKDYENIVFIDALSTPLGPEAFEQYVDYSAMAKYYSSNNNTASLENSDKAKQVLEQDWKNRIYNGQFIVYSYHNTEGEKLNNAQGVLSLLQAKVQKRFSLVFDFHKGLTENQMKLTSGKACAKCGIIQSTNGVVVGIEKHILSNVWKMEKYWENPATISLPISKIKIDIENEINKAFDSDGQISIGELYDHLERKYGFAPCNLSAFFTGFILKEYGGEPYRYSDSSGSHEPMTQEKLAEMIGNYIGKRPKPTYIIKMTVEEKGFYDLTEKVWNIDTNSCSSAGQAALVIAAKIRGFGLPMWCLSEIDTYGIYGIVEKYIELVQKEGKEAHKKAIEIGHAVIRQPLLIDTLPNFITIENIQNGMLQFLKTFESGKLLNIANEIGAKNNLITDIKDKFSVKHSSLWDQQTGENEIRYVLNEYEIIKRSNKLLNTMSNSLVGTDRNWRDKLKFIGISYEALQSKYPELSKLFGTLLRIYKEEDILPEQRKLFLSDLIKHDAVLNDFLKNEKEVFKEIYFPYLDGFNNEEIIEIKNKLNVGLFQLNKTDCNEKVRDAADDYRKSQLKTKMFNIWKKKTKTKNPRDWSYHYRTPILCMVPDNEFSLAKKAFETLNKNWAPDSDIKSAITFLENTSLFDVLSDTSKHNELFNDVIIGKYKPLLINPDKIRDRLERLAIDTYEWYENPKVKGIIKELAVAEYNAGGSNRALNKIDIMDDKTLKHYLKRLVSENINVGIEIIIDGGE